ncbi:Hypothetical protein I595_884 [Croceitalea dokdonensis DOKDO 023]|uniref:Uncharacterized protein n=1 Tax=Croceitalea dokdonensis DOKDO 023 TaxID=1300341 RepID=A0A0N8H460_9FLAO|nr:Hypothetical protein I595_884 [Croceitalea dokdonensis DOKDO 023]
MTKKLSTLSTNATRMAVVNLLVVTPGKTSDNNKTAKALNRIRNRNFINGVIN